MEFALVAMIFFTLLFGIFEAGRVLLAQNALQYAVEEATRYNIAHEDTTVQQLEEIVLRSMSEMLVAADDVVMTGPSYTVVSGVNFVEMRVRYRFRPFLLTFFPASWAEIDLTATSRMPVR